MDFLKENLQKSDNIYKKEILDQTTLEIANFYNYSPFPNYKHNDNKQTILEKGKKNFVTNEFKKFIGFDKDILEVGCGTGQLTSFLAIGTNNRIVALDSTIKSLTIAQNFAKKNEINNIHFINADIFHDVFKNESFDFIWCNGVLHHTKDPYGSFKLLTKILKKNGYLVIGLYNKIGRLRTIFRKYLYKIFGKSILKILDPILRDLKDEPEEQIAWIRDQYNHPIESLHTLDEVLKWFDKNNIDFINSLPASDFEHEKTNLFEERPRGNFFSRIINQIFMIFSKQGSDGGLFIVIGKKK